MNNNNLTNLNDRQLVSIAQDKSNRRLSNSATEVLVQRYQMQINKGWRILKKQFNDSALIRSYEDEYFSQAYEAIFTSISKIDLNKIYNDDWKLMQYNSFYLKNVRSAIIRQAFKDSKNCSLDHVSATYNDNIKGNDYEVEEAYQFQTGYKDNPEYVVIKKEEEDERMKVLKTRYNEWSDEKKFIFDQLMKGVSEKEIAAKLNKPRNYIYNKVTWLKKDLKKAFKIA